MSFFQNVHTLWQSWRTVRRASPARGRRSPAPIEPLEVRTLLAGEFTDLGALGLPGVDFSSVAWGDMDNDGDLDILLTGRDLNGGSTSKVYRNNGDSTFTDINAGLTGVQGGSVAWGDYDNDGDLDILLTGYTGYTGNPYILGTSISKVYRNNGNSTFTDINAGLPGVSYSSAAWGDMDNDGDLDILLIGDTDVSSVYRNNGDNTFTDIHAGLADFRFSSAAWGDMDNDGDLDILLTGTYSGDVWSKVYRNNGDSTFTDINAGLPGVMYGSVAWGDMDNDGDLDILLTGLDLNRTPMSKVYRNDGNSTFTDVNAGLTAVGFGSVAWGDVDNDGDLDILLAGLVNNTPTKIAKVYRNNGDSTFTDINAGLANVSDGSVAWGDMDNDGDLDTLLTGANSSSGGIAKVYRNNATTANTAPTAPTNLTATITASRSLTFHWTAATDTQTAANGLSYNLRVGTTPGGSDVFSTMASTTNGVRRLADAGPIQGTSYTLKNLTPGQTYYWSVQAIDTALAGSPFAVENSAVPTTIPTLGGAVANQAVNDTSTITPLAAFTVT